MSEHLMCGHEEILQLAGRLEVAAGPPRGMPVFVASLLPLLQRNILRISGDPRWDIDRVEVVDQSWAPDREGSADQDQGGELVVLRGFWGEEGPSRRVRLHAELAGEPRGAGVEIAVMATHGDLDASSPARDTRRDERHGNPALLARSLACVVYTARRHGMRPLIADPINEAVAAHYRNMGFALDPHRGTGLLSLDVGDRRNLRRVSAFVMMAEQKQRSLTPRALLEPLRFEAVAGD